MKIFSLLLSLLILTGCTSLSPSSQPPSEFEQWEQHKAHLSELKNWQMDSRIFIQTKEDGFSSSIRWIQQDQSYQLHFSAPFSQGIYHLTGDPEKVSIHLPDNTEQSARDPETLMKKTLGFRLPVSGLSYWLRGLPYPDEPDRNIILDRNERLSELKQAGWNIRISRYIHKNGYYLPTKLKMENRHLKMKMVVNKWIIPTQ